MKFRSQTLERNDIHEFCRAGSVFPTKSSKTNSVAKWGSRNDSTILIKANDTRIKWQSRIGARLVHNGKEAHEFFAIQHNDKLPSKKGNYIRVATWVASMWGGYTEQLAK